VDIATSGGDFFPRIFLHFLDRYHRHFACRVLGHPDRLVTRELRTAFRLACLLSDEVLLSASAYFENPTTRRILREHMDFCEAGFVFLCARDDTLAEHFDRKQRDHYSADSPAELRSSYSAMRRVPILFRSGDIETSREIRRRWMLPLEAGRLYHWLDPAGRRSLPADLEESWGRIPEVLGQKAFVLPHVVEGFRLLRTRQPPELRIMELLDSGYTLSHSVPMGCGLVHELLYARMPWHLESQPGFSYKRARDAVLGLGLLDEVERADSAALLRLRLSAHWAAIAPVLTGAAEERNGASAEAVDGVRRELRSAVARRTRKEKPVLRVGVVTALPEEWLAVVTALRAEETHSTADDPNRYALATVVNPVTGAAVVEAVVTFLPRMGTNSAAAAATNLLRSYPDVSDLIMSGIACGCPIPGDPDKHVRLGDVVVSDQDGMVQVDHQAVVDTRVEHRSSMPLPSRRLLNCVRLLQSDELSDVRPWNLELESLIERNPRFRRPPSATDVLLDEAGSQVRHPRDPARRAGWPKIVHGRIGSSNTLFRSSSFRDSLSHQHRLRALEMEGAGTAEAVWQFGKSYLVVRGICDYGDDRTKNDKWHHYAAAAAAAYTKAILLRLARNTDNH